MTSEKEKELMHIFEQFLEETYKTPVFKLYKDEKGRYRDPVTLMLFQTFIKGVDTNLI